MTTLTLYHRLNLRSKRAILKTKKRWGHPYRYNPRQILLSRLSQETGLSIEQIKEQLFEEREWLLAHKQYFL
jgi:hypothetical protein